MTPPTWLKYGWRDRDYKHYYTEEYNYKLAGEGDFTPETGLDQSVFNWIRPQLPPTKALKILEIGCNAGFLLRRFKDQGFKTFGLEPGQKAAAFARQAHGLQVQCGMLEDFQETGGKYDVILLIQTLEHFSDPLNSLLKIKSLLKEDGLLFVEVPNYYAPHGFYSFKANGKYTPSPNHLFIYVPKTLRSLLRKARFSVQGTSFTWLNLRVVARNRDLQEKPEFESYRKVSGYFQLLPFILKGVDSLRFLKGKFLKSGCGSG